MLAGRASPAPPKAPGSPRFEGVLGASRILAAQPKLLSPGELCTRACRETDWYVGVHACSWEQSLIVWWLPPLLL